MCPRIFSHFPKIARKIASYSDDSQYYYFRCLAEFNPRLETKKGVTPPLHTVEAFLLALASPSDGVVLSFVLGHCNNTLSDGRIILTTEVSKDRVEIKYQQLNPASHFLELVQASRCVILAGGTMSPVSTKYSPSCSLRPPLSHAYEM